MAAPNINYDELITTTAEKRQSEVVDLMSKNIPLFHFLNKKGNLKTFSGGRKITIPLEYAENTTVMNYSGYELLDPTPQTILTSAEFEIKQKAVAITYSGLETLINGKKGGRASREQAVKLIATRYTNAEKSLRNSLGSDCFSTGLADDGKQLTGLQAGIPDTVSGTTYGGISRTTYPWWRPYVKDCTTDFGAPANVANFPLYISNMGLNVANNGDTPQHLFADNNYYQLAWQAAFALTRVAPSNEVDLGFRTLMIDGYKIIAANGSNNNCPTNHVYGLDIDYIYLYVHEDCNFTKLGPDRVPTNQDATISYIGWAGNLVCSNQKAQYLLKD